MLVKTLVISLICTFLPGTAAIPLAIANRKFDKFGKLGLNALKIDTKTLPIVATNKGLVRGSIVATKNGNLGYAFQNIPYAQPPTGNLRFRPPKPAHPWTGVRDCGEYGPACYQPRQSPGAQTVQNFVSEDCLSINVYVPFHNLSRDSAIYPVLYIIHGGGWEFDSPRMYPVESIIDNFVSKGLIVTFVTYRLGVFGFFTTGTDEVRGNQALQDIILGLKWVQDEISHFSGDPNKVTIQGESSAAAAVELLSFMPQTKGLFHQLIVMSGSAIESGGENDLDIKTYKNLASAIGCNNNSGWDHGRFDVVLSCMQRLTSASILHTYDSIKFGPAHPRVDGKGGLLPEPFPELAAARRQMPLMIGTLLHESGTFIGRTVGNATAAQVSAICQLSAMNLSPNYPDAIYAACNQRYVVEYLMQHNESTDHAFWHQQSVALLDEESVFNSVFKGASSMRDANGTVYLYSLDYVRRGQEAFGPWHAMDLTLLFDIDYFELFPYKTKDDIAISNIHSDLFCNFAKFGNPTPAKSQATFEPWKSLETPVGFNYYSINLTPTNKPYYHFDALVFWEQIVPSLKDRPNLIGWIDNKQELFAHISDFRSYNLNKNSFGNKLAIFHKNLHLGGIANENSDSSLHQEQSHNGKVLGINDSRFRLKLGNFIQITKAAPDADALPWIILLSLLGFILLISIIYVIYRLRRGRSPDAYERHAHPGRTGMTPHGSRQNTPRGSLTNTPRGSFVGSRYGSMASRNSKGEIGKPISEHSSIAKALAESTRMSIGVAAPSLRRNTSHEVYSYTHYRTIKY